MQTIEQWLQEYESSHRNRTNKITHWICVPAIMFSILGLCWSFATPAVFQQLPVELNWAIIVVVLSLLYYAFLSLPLALGMLVVSTLMLAGVVYLNTLTIPLWQISLFIFVVAWIGQFIGHKVEGKKPSFFKDVQFLLIGPVWILADIYRRYGISY